MNLSQSSVAVLYLASLLLGAVLGFLYDGFRMVRILFGEHFSRRAVQVLQKRKFPDGQPERQSPRKRNAAAVFLFLGDFLFCVLASISLILLFYECNNGNIRPFAIFCAAVGFFLYRATLGKAVMLFSEVIVFTVRYAVGRMIFLILLPFRKLGGIILRRLKRACGKCRETHWKRRRKRYTEKCFADVKITACGLLPYRERMKSSGKDNQNAGTGKKSVNRKIRKKTAV